MSDLWIDTSEQFKEAAARATDLFNAGTDQIDLPAIRRACFIQGYAAALIDMKHGEDRRKLLNRPPKRSKA